MEALMQQSIIEQNRLNGNVTCIKDSLKRRHSDPSFLASPLSPTKNASPEYEPPSYTSPIEAARHNIYDMLVPGTQNHGNKQIAILQVIICLYEDVQLFCHKEDLANATFTEIA